MLSLFSLASIAFAVTVTKTLTIANAEASPDGFKNTGSVVDGQFPRPLIKANQSGDDFEITVADVLKDESLALVTSIHWHGFFQKGKNGMDGVATLTR
ncbi:laccase-like protein [Peniophora sp. CONT]|nr:laccase-like protein [Peniophora sp. CONT]